MSICRSAAVSRDLADGKNLPSILQMRGTKRALKEASREYFQTAKVRPYRLRKSHRIGELARRCCRPGNHHHMHDIQHMAETSAGRRA
jgi:hypothetical protein